MTWANQIRVMGELFNKLKVAIGRGFIGMLKPLVRAVNRALNTIIDIVEQVVNALGIIFGWEVDIGNVGLAEEWEDTAGYADDAAGAMGDAADSAKKLKDYTLGIDELNIFHPDDDGSGSGGGGGGAGGGGGGANKIPVEWDNDGNDLSSRFLDLIQKIVRPFQEAWKLAGDYVIAAWEYMTEQLTNLARDVARDLLEVWNQDATIEMLANVYRIVGDIFVTIGNLAMRLDEAWNYNQTGLHILENIRDIFAVLIEHVRNVTSYMRLWSYYLDFKPLLTSFEELTRALVTVADFVGRIFEDLMINLVLPYIQHLIEVSIPNLNKALTSIINNVDWDKLARNIHLIIVAGEGLLETITDALVQTVADLGIAVGNFVNSDEFQQFCENLADFLDRIDGKTLVMILDAIGYTILDIGTALLQFLNSETFLTFIDNIASFLERVTEPMITNIIGGIGQGIIDIAEALATFVNSENFQTFLNNVASFLERVDQEMIEKILSSIGLAIIDIADALTSFINSEPFQKFLDSILTYLESATAEDIASKIEGLAIAIAAFEFSKFAGTGLINFLSMLDKMQVMFGAGEMASVPMGLGATSATIASIADLFDRIEKNKAFQALMSSGDVEAIQAASETPFGEEDRAYRTKWSFLPEGVLKTLDDFHDKLETLKGTMDTWGEKLNLVKKSAEDAHPQFNNIVSDASSMHVEFNNIVGDASTFQQDVDPISQALTTLGNNLNEYDWGSLWESLGGAVPTAKANINDFMLWWSSQEGVVGWLYDTVFPDFSE